MENHVTFGIGKWVDAVDTVQRVPVVVSGDGKCYEKIAHVVIDDTSWLRIS